MAASPSTDMQDLHLSGSCKALYCFSIARALDLQMAATLLKRTQRLGFKHKHHVVHGEGLEPPLRIDWEVDPLELDNHPTAASVEVSLFDLGTLSITWSIPIDAPLSTLVELSAELFDHTELIARSRRVAEEVQAAIMSALTAPDIGAAVEDYVIFQVQPLEGGPERLLREARTPLAQLLRAEANPLSEQEIDAALSSPISYGTRDVCLVDWLAAFLTGSEMDDERLVLELATVELLELRRLDTHLSSVIEDAGALMARPRKLLSGLTLQGRELERIARIQADDARLHEGIDNGLKLFGDDYLARLYSTASRRFHFEKWDYTIQRKLGVLRSIYQGLADQAAHRRSEALEWIIVILIAIELLLYLTPVKG